MPACLKLNFSLVNHTLYFLPLICANATLMEFKPYETGLNYMRIARQPAGYLVNFGHKGTLEWKGFIL